MPATATASKVRVGYVIIVLQDSEESSDREKVMNLLALLMLFVIERKWSQVEMLSLEGETETVIEMPFVGITYATANILAEDIQAFIDETLPTLVSA